ncbi:MAG: type II toxin-antitoxin system RelE/ParE family toxin [Thermoplasmata archaeon]
MDTSAIDDFICKIKEASIKKQILKKLEKIKENPDIGTPKRFKLKHYYVVKVNNQRIIILYKFDEKDPCKIVCISIGTHEEVYQGTY